MTSYAIRIGSSARNSLLSLSEAAFEQVSGAIDALSTMPMRGRIYEPTYEAAQLPFSCRVLFVGTYGIYYTVFEDVHEVYVRYLEDQRMDPKWRFTGRLR